MRLSARLARPTRPDIDPSAVVSLQLIPSVWAEDARLWIRQAPICAEIENTAFEAWAEELAAYNGDGGACTARNRHSVESYFAVDNHGVEKVEAGGDGGEFGDVGRDLLGRG